MQTIVAGLMALTAMGASILADVDPVTVVLRGGIAYVIGLLATGLWTSIINPQEKAEKKKKEPKPAKQAKPEPSEVESNEDESEEEEQEEAA